MQKPTENRTFSFTLKTNQMNNNKVTLTDEQIGLQAYKTSMDKVIDKEISLLERDVFRHGYFVGAKWALQHMQSDAAVDFAEWLHYNQFKRHISGDDRVMWKSTKIHFGSESEYYTTQQIYDIFKQSKPTE
jgi:hypothetical protein